MKFSPTLTPLDSELIIVLRAVAKSNLSALSVINAQAVFSVRQALLSLVDQGYVQQHTGGQRDGVAKSLYSPTAKGESALRSANEVPFEPSLASVATPRRASTRPAIYQGAELRPYIGRAGALDAFRHPSRGGAHLHHPDGSVTPVR